MQNKKQPLVTVIMITYGHENYIKQAIEGVLMQEYYGEIELIVANDKSPDTTDLVVNEIIQEHHNGSWIKYIRHEVNLGMNPNFIFAVNKAKGKYIAICEGDDYWTDPLKLQKQVDFLEVNEEFVACQHDRNLLYNDGSLVFEKSDLYIFTQCFVFRNVLDNTFYRYVKNVLNADTFLEYYLKLFGKIKHLDFVGAVYRITNSGVYTRLDNTAKMKGALYTFKQFLHLESELTTSNSKIVYKIIKSKITEFQFAILIENKLNKSELIQYLEYVIKYRRFFCLIEMKRIGYVLIRFFQFWNFT